VSCAPRHAGRAFAIQDRTLASEVPEVVLKSFANAVLRTNIINMLETHLPDERKAIAERRAALEAELALLADYDSTLERIENAMGVASRPTILPITRRTGT
jgi:hypothetical protein